MKKAIGKMVFIDRNDPVFQTNESFSDFEVNTISAGERSYTGFKVNGIEFHCLMRYWKYEPYDSPREATVNPVVGKELLMNFYDRSGDNWEKVKILFVGKEVFVFERDGVESSAHIEGNEFRDLESKK